MGGIGVELDSSGKQCCLIKALKALSLAFSRFSRSVSVLISSVSFLISSVSILICSILLNLAFNRRSSSGSRRQFSIDNHCRHRGSDARDPPLLLKGDGVAGEVEVVIGGQEGDQAKNEATHGLGEAKTIEVEASEALGWR